MDHVRANRSKWEIKVKWLMSILWVFYGVHWDVYYWGNNEQNKLPDWDKKMLKRANLQGNECKEIRPVMIYYTVDNVRATYDAYREIHVLDDWLRFQKDLFIDRIMHCFDWGINGKLNLLGTSDTFENEEVAGETMNC